MKTRSLLFAVISGAALLTAQSASAVLIDDFVTPHDVSVAGSTLPVSATSSSPAITAIGGYRDMTVTKTSGSSSQSVIAEVNPLGEDRLYVTLGVARGTAEIRWDGVSTSLNVSGLGGMDLVGGLLNPFFALSLATSDHVGPISFTVYQQGSTTNYATGTITTPNGLNSGDPAIMLSKAFSDFLLAGTSTASLTDIFTNVGAIVMLIDARAAAQEGWDLSLNYVTTGGTVRVSLPGGLALLGLGLALMRRRTA